VLKAAASGRACLRAIAQPNEALRGRDKIIVFVFHEAVCCPEIKDRLIGRAGAHLNLLHAYSVAADFPIEALKMSPLTRFHHCAIQHSASSS
jgi:hypothetical protein